MKFMSSMMILSCVLLAGSSHAAIVKSDNMSASLPVHKKINLNTASAEELSHAVKGIGKKRAVAIVQYRQKHGHFKNITELAAVKGIGLHFVQTHRSQLETIFIL